MPDAAVLQNIAEQPAILRLGHHAIELGKAADEIGSAPLSASVRATLIEVGREIARSRDGPKTRDTDTT